MGFLAAYPARMQKIAKRFEEVGGRELRLWEAFCDLVPGAFHEFSA